jgi:fatty-acyl-CoA synthase
MYREDRRPLRLGQVIVQYFGLGEVTGNITVLPPNLHEAEDGPNARIGTCGFERTGMQVQIRRTRRQRSSPAFREICVIGPAVFAGYYDSPEANAKSRNGWFRRRSRPYGRTGLRLHHRPGLRTCTSPAARTSIRARSRRRS